MKATATQTRRSLFVVVCTLAVSVGSGCGCTKDPNPQADASVDAGPTVCVTTADCTAAGLSDQVCDPTNKICQPKCTEDSQCEYVANGFCEKRDGTCRGLCTAQNNDYCSELGDLLCLPRTGRCVEKCKRDDDCSTIDPGSICNEMTGACFKNGVHGCSMDSDCNSFYEPTDYCFVGGIQCRCVMESNDAGYAGVCKRRRAVCDECTTDDQCGSGTTFDPQGACQALSGDSSGKKYCFQKPNGSCGCGFVASGPYCKPQSNSCENSKCTADRDCKGGAVCNTQSCLCEPRCRWDFANQETSPGCPSGKSCWVDNANLDPNSIYYGAGRCRPPCTVGGTECTDTVTNPNGGPKLTCATEKVGMGMSMPRCRANGECMDDLECPEQPESSNYLGYCDRGRFQCKTDCRVGLDPLTNKPYQDCRAPYACALDAGVPFCRLQTCAELGGASVACSQGEYCCGEDKDGDGNADPCPPANQLQPNNCYTAPKPPFCTPCESPDDCKNLTVPSWFGCTNGSKSPNCSPYPMLCFQVDDTTGVCAPPTFNDSTRDSNGVGRDNKGCPANYPPLYYRIRFTMGGDPNNCNTDADCNVGTDAGRCAPDPTLSLPDGGHPRSCLCTVGQPNQCPNTPDGGVFSFCRSGTPGQTQACMQTVACLPSAAVVHGAPGAPKFGCGL